MIYCKQRAFICHSHDCLAAQPDNVTAATTSSKPLFDPSKNLANLANIQSNMNVTESKINQLVSGLLNHPVKPDATSTNTTFASVVANKAEPDILPRA